MRFPRRAAHNKKKRGVMINNDNIAILPAIHISLCDDGAVVPIEVVDRERYVQAEVTVRDAEDTDKTKSATVPAEFIEIGRAHV